MVLWGAIRSVSAAGLLIADLGAADLDNCHQRQVPGMWALWTSFRKDVYADAARTSSVRYCFLTRFVRIARNPLVIQNVLELRQPPDFASHERYSVSTLSCNFFDKGEAAYLSVTTSMYAPLVPRSTALSA